MTVRYHCDGPDCVSTMTRDQPRLALTAENPTPPFDPNEGGEFPLIETSFEFFSDGDFHFCSDACITGWAYARHLEAQT